MGLDDLATGGLSALPYPFVYLITLGIAYLDAFPISSKSSVIVGQSTPSTVITWIGDVINGTLSAISGKDLITNIMNLAFGWTGIIFPPKSFFFLFLLVGVLMVMTKMSVMSN